MRKLVLLAVAGAALVATFVTSSVGLISFEVLAWFGRGFGPDWSTGLLLGVGGIAGSYLGARLQRHAPEIGIKAVLGVLAAGLGVDYLHASLRK